jgi:hypothetical protein
MAFFGVDAPHGLVEVYRRFKGDRSDGGGSKNLWNVAKFLPDITV